jgi:ABC-type multidrug transport system fused ATPase/permease subunit
MLDNHHIDLVDVNALRRKIGYVGEDPFIFNTTIRENMLFAAPDATDPEI